ncbi:MAG: RNA helicase [Hyphomicrobium sp.]|nr:RNA helicase [Hyphomicrobium sp.]PPD08992.1 MAG: RNA helicase [Hyphomicrobium sp.]
MTTFQELGLDPLLLKALDTEGYTTPTPIQAQAIPTILEGKDLLGIAQTGTGKTAAFALPILQRLNTNRQPPLRKGVRALILSPTRELATQIAESFRTYGRHMGFSVAVVFGGVAHKPQRDALARGVDVLVATPGRLLDHMGERNVTLEGTEILVLDEADQMMDLGFIRPLRQIVATLSHRRQSLFFSATMPHEIGALAAELLKDPVKVSVSPVSKTADRVAQEVIFVEQNKKRALLVELFADPEFTRTIVFTRTKRGADRVARHLETAGVPVSAIHGNKSQAQRDQAMRGFKAGKIRALIATDIAARGIDVDAVSHVINYEIPNVPESYVHRIGRTARAGAEGTAISLVDNEERGYLRDIERLTRLTIPSKDRRNDATLVAPVESRAERDAERADLSPGGARGQRGGPRTDRPRSFASRGGEGRDRSGGEQRDRGGDRRDGNGGRPQRPRFDDRGPRPEGRGDRDGARGFSRGAPRGEQTADRGADRVTNGGGERRPFDPMQAKPERPAHERPRSFDGRRDDNSSDRPNFRRDGDRPHRDERPQGRGERTERGGESRTVTHYGDRTSETRPQGERSFGERSFGDRPHRGGDGRGPNRSDDKRGPRGGDRPHRDHAPRGEHASRDGDRRPHGAEGRPRFAGGKRDGEHRGPGDRPAKPHAHGRPALRSDRADGPAKGLDGVKFMGDRGGDRGGNRGGNRGDGPRGRPSAPRGDDRRKAPRNA